MRDDRAEAGPFVALEEVATAVPGGGRALMDWLLAHPEIRRVPTSVREDATQSVACKLLSRAASIGQSVRHANPGGAPEILDEKLTAYVGAMVRNKAKDLLRNRAWRPLAEADLVLIVDLDHRLELRDALNALQLGTERVAARSPEAGEVVDQLVGLATGHVTMDDLVCRELGGEGDERARARARDRIYKRHRRARVAIVGALGAMRDEGRFRAATVDRAVSVAEVMLRARSL